MKDNRLSAVRHCHFEKTLASICEIAEPVGASRPIVRRSPLTLETEGAIHRTHGGTRIADCTGIWAAFEVREQACVAVTRAIGVEAINADDNASFKNQLSPQRGDGSV